MCVNRGPLGSTIIKENRRGRVWRRGRRDDARVSVLQVAKRGAHGLSYGEHVAARARRKMDQVSRKWGPGLKANEGNVSATEPSRTLNVVEVDGTGPVHHSSSRCLAPWFPNGFLACPSSHPTVGRVPPTRAADRSWKSWKIDFEVGIFQDVFRCGSRL